MIETPSSATESAVSPAAQPPLAGRAALVTGASRGIGRAIALDLARAGARVVVNFLREESAANDVAREIREDGGQVEVIQADISKVAEARALVDGTIARLGSIDILVNNAGIHRGALVHLLAEDDWHAVLEANLTGAFLCTKFAVPHMLERGWGRIVNMSSVIGQVGFPGDAAYATTKAGLVGFTRAVSLELASKGVTVNAVLPGFIDTSMTGSLPVHVQERLDVRIPQKRRGRPEEVAELVTFLCTGAEYLTGAVLTLDGAYTAA